MTPETYELAVPDEPAPGSVVVDKDGLAWQRTDRPVFTYPGDTPATWVAARYSEGDGRPLNWRWATLLTERGPLTLVHLGAKEDH